VAVRVLQVIGGSQFGGAVWVILAYAQALQEHGCEVTVCSSVDSIARVFRDAGCEVVSVPEMVREIDPRKDAPAVLKLAQLCRAGRYDVVHTHTSKGGFIGRAAARLAGVPVVLHTAHGFAFHEGSSRRSIAFYTALERLAAHWCDRVITVSEFHRQWAIRLGIASPEKIVTIRNGVSRSRLRTSRTRLEARDAFGFGGQDVVLGSVGRLAPQKGLETLIGVLPAVLERNPRVRLLLAGDGPSRDELHLLAERAGVASVVRILDFQESVGDVLNAIDIVVAPSLREGLSISVLEAMALGKPTIATNIGSNLELIEDGVSGRLVAPNARQPLVEAIVQLAADPILAQRYGDAAKRRFELGFTEQAMKDALWSLYRELLSGHPAMTAGLVATR
jgi:glycosyltransferase involved in cell wall biosynthesis